MATRNRQRFTAVAFTINNYTEQDINLLNNNDVNYCCYEREIGAHGTEHIQGYLQFARQLDMAAVKIILPRGHFERARGSYLQNKTYCSKENNGTFVEFGTPRGTQGTRNDLSEIKNLIINEKKPIREIVINNVCNYQQLRFAENLVKYQLPSGWTCEKEVRWYYGATGTGKSHAAHEECDPDDTWIAKTQQGQLQWFDGYYGQKNVIMDDFRASWLRLNELLRLTDKYWMSVPVKGSFVPWTPKLIIITTPRSIDETYNSENEDIDQLKRRIRTVKHFSDPFNVRKSQN